MLLSCKESPAWPLEQGGLCGARCAAAGDGVGAAPSPCCVWPQSRTLLPHRSLETRFPPDLGDGNQAEAGIMLL